VNFNHVIINKEFPNVFACYSRSKHKNQMPKKLQFLVSNDVMLEYVCAKLVYITMYF